ncbi:MAG: UPF0489 family protein [Candidatus Omnitrophica bacterium]|nr:UPF0489 family protein [Candidatus Omnitrophota bacterium]
MNQTPKSPICVLTILSFFVTLVMGPIPMARADEWRLPAPGVMVHLSPPLEPPILKGIKVYPDDPLRFDFILDQGDQYPEGREGLKREAARLVQYFLASLTVPEEDLWVNLSPYEKDRIIPPSFGSTRMGRDLLAEDYLLKQVTASLIYPEGQTGKKFWKRVYEEARKKYGTTDIAVNTFNKVWILPQKAVVYENSGAQTAYVISSRLKVMLDQDYLSLEKHEGSGAAAVARGTNQLGSQVIREIVIPELTREVNEDENFAVLRQVYNSLILATWYKMKIKKSVLAQAYAGKNKVAGVGFNGPLRVEAIYRRYLQAFKKGVYNYIEEKRDPLTRQMVPRKYFSGGVKFDLAMMANQVIRYTDQMPNAAMTVPKSLKVIAVSLAFAGALGLEYSYLKSHVPPEPDINLMNLSTGKEFVGHEISERTAVIGATNGVFWTDAVEMGDCVVAVVIDREGKMSIAHFFNEDLDDLDNQVGLFLGRLGPRPEMVNLIDSYSQILPNVKEAFQARHLQTHEVNVGLAGSHNFFFGIKKSGGKITAIVADDTRFGGFAEEYEYLVPQDKGHGIELEIKDNAMASKAQDTGLEALKNVLRSQLRDHPLIKFAGGVESVVYKGNVEGRDIVVKGVTDPQVWSKYDEYQERLGPLAAGYLVFKDLDVNVGGHIIRVPHAVVQQEVVPLLDRIRSLRRIYQDDPDVLHQKIDTLLNGYFKLYKKLLARGFVMKPNGFLVDVGSAGGTDRMVVIDVGDLLTKEEAAEHFDLENFNRGFISALMMDTSFVQYTSLGKAAQVVDTLAELNSAPGRFNYTIVQNANRDFSNGKALVLLAPKPKIKKDSAMKVSLKSFAEAGFSSINASGITDWDIVDGWSDKMGGQLIKGATAKDGTIYGLTKKVLIDLKKGPMVFISDDHSNVFTFWWLMLRQGMLQKGLSLLHIDAHPDARITRRYNSSGGFLGENTDKLIEADRYAQNVLGIEGFIAPFVKEGFIASDKSGLPYWHWLYNLDTLRAVQMIDEGPVRYAAQPGSSIDPQEKPYDLVDVDLDVFNGYSNAEVETMLDKIAQMAVKAKAVSIVTSPNFIDQHRAILMARQLMDKIAMAHADQSMTPTGGIDLTAAHMDLQTQHAGQGINFHMDPAMLTRLQNAPGFVPVIIDIQPMKDLGAFLGGSMTQGDR